MPRKTKLPLPVLPVIPAELLEQFSNGPMTVQVINAATLALKRTLIERALTDELNHHPSRLGPGHSFLRLTASDTKGHLHDQCH
ncbi:hypothetical protein LQZ44_15485 [Alcaligenes nematophilus]|uniref:hypothetical protein n=1 Tax=Alcaligenes nematophilus TaxID=2994643 RepID=UPI0035B50A1C